MNKNKALLLSVPGFRSPRHVSVVLANTFWSRAIGLLSRSMLLDSEALLITPCASIHTFGMRFAIDVVFLDSFNRVLAIRSDVKPFRVCYAPRGTRSVMELAAGNATRTGIALNNTLSFD